MTSPNTTDTPPSAIARVLRDLTIAAIVAGTCSLFQGTPAAAQPTPEPLGMWLTDGAKGRVRISRCGDALCGDLAWLREPMDETGQPKKDKHNADATKRGRPLVGVPILLSMKRDGDRRWTGSIYNAEDGKTYTAYLTMESDAQLRVEGCVLGGMICRKQTWTRAR
jgi:uncharacterized protein (DUF2147 family)